MGLDFSQFHPLDHRIGGPRCRHFYGGWRQHLGLLWYFGTWRERLSMWAHRLVLCRIGRHREGLMVRGYRTEQPVVRPSCFWCDWTRLPSEADIDLARQIGRHLDPDE